MKVLMINGGPHENGNTRAALDEVFTGLAEYGVERELCWLGTEPARGCVGCGGCENSGRCVFDGRVNETLDIMDSCDGLIIGSPVHYASPAGALVAFLDRFFYAGGGAMARKPGAAIAVARRGGTTAALDMLNKYFLISEMPVVPSVYWNMAHGRAPGEVTQDGEGMQTMRVLGRNMGWLLRSIEAGRKAGVALPRQEERVRTNFIR